MNTMTQWNPLRDLEEMQDRVLRTFGRGLGRRIPEGQQPLTMSEWAPSVDIVEDDHEYLIKAELPEVNKEDVKVTVDNDVVTIKGERKFEKEEKNKKYHRIERSYGSFERSFAIPDDAAADKVTADFKEGLLEVHLGKCEEKRSPHIEVAVL
ncbi:MAG: Hsp20/alpha crystallin family protein [Verrucomicrobia bacterium]|nr:MAG: Hsp20/alpha crystallin family protein [Verrucomicrobiota bacterium]